MYERMKKILSPVLNLFFHIDIKGTNHIPKEGPFIIASNHFSYLDATILALAFNEKIHFLAKKELFKNKLYRWFFESVHAIPVNRESACPIRAIRFAFCVLVIDRAVLGIFPEGTHRKKHKIIPAKPGVAYLSRKTGASILPVYLEKITLRKWKVIIGLPVIIVNNKDKINAQYIMKQINELGENR